MNHIKTIHIQGKKPGAHLVIFGGVHGNEPCGTIALEEVSKSLVLDEGEVTIVARANPQAHDLGKRFVEEDLNRVFRKTETPLSYEANLAEELTSIIDAGDAFLDIHSTKAHGETAVFVDRPTSANQAFADSLGAKWAIYGWDEVYEQHPVFRSYDTTRYANEQGKVCVLVECGQHEDPESVDRAKVYIFRALQHFGLIKKTLDATPNAPVKKVRMTHLYGRVSAGDAFTKIWEHLEVVPAHTPIATREGGETIVFDKQKIILLPKHSALPGSEWFYLGDEIS
jgi:predicted deacylase